MMYGLLTCDQLLHVTGYERPSDLCRALDAQGVRYFKGKGGKPWTTIDLINAAAGLVRPAYDQQDELLDPDDV